MKFSKKTSFLFAAILFFGLSACDNSQPKRSVISLNGMWEVAESMDTIPPQDFTREIPVPGLIDLALPAFKNSGYRYSDLGRDTTGDPEFGRKYYWYRKVLDLDQDPGDFAILKVHKAKFGHVVYVNGHYVGSYHFCFTPSFFDISKFLNYNSGNEILIRVGASPDQLPENIPFGFEIEKSVYYSGIYDRVELFTGNYPYIENVQVVPDIEDKTARVILYIQNGPDKLSSDFHYQVRERDSRKSVAQGKTKVYHFDTHSADTLHLEIGMHNSKLWSPENPFLYELEVESTGDTKNVIFGMREFRFDTLSRLALLNEKPYYLRGTNIAMHRFFEDPVRQALPWNRDWVEGMHEEFKDMHWNSYRFHVGFAPELWYEVADEKGFLVQDEYAIWALFLKDSSMYSTLQQDRHQADILAEEYRAWMRERWNHPSMVIWDAQNETWWDETGKAIEMVRHLDHSNRPWDNGFSPPQSPTDMMESHPYLFAHDQALTFNVNREWPEEGLLKHDLGKHPEPFNDPNLYEPPANGGKYNNPVIVNEYGWIWLYRDGSPSSVAEKIWRFYPEYDTPEERWEWRGRVIAAKTEYWRSRRDVAGVQHFCMLTCDRPWEPRSQVSDDWKDVENLIMQPLFKEFVKPAFSPVGLFVDKFDRDYLPGELIRVPVVAFNDLDDSWEGELQLKIVKEDSILNQTLIDKIVIQAYGRTSNELEIRVPEESGVYDLRAEIEYQGEVVFSTRRFRIN